MFMGSQISLDSEDLYLQLKNYLENYANVLAVTDRRALGSAMSVLLDRFTDKSFIKSHFSTKK